jgi:toxin ParE1/3/4
MDFKLIVSPRAQKEIFKSIDFYALDSNWTPLNFIIAIEKAYKVLAQNPYCRIRYKDVRAIKLKKFPFLIYFVINEKHQSVKVLSCFHTKRSPSKRPRIM